MKFNDTSNQHDSICHDVDRLSHTDTTSYPLIEKTLSANDWLRKIGTWIWQAVGTWEFDDSNHTDFPIATTDLNDSQDDYSLPTDILKIERVEVKDEQGNWKRLSQIDKSEINIALDEFRETDGNPQYYKLFANSLRLLPASDYDSAAGLMVYFSRDVSIFTPSDTTKSPGFVVSFHRMLSYGIALDYAMANELTTKITLFRDMVERYKRDLIEFYGSRPTRDDTLKIKPRKENYK